MADITTPVNPRGAWFVYSYRPGDDIQVSPVGVYNEDDELEALRAANRLDHHCIWWPYGMGFEEADALHWGGQR
jgi:hypothetical protein